jgi:hypothetical protein
VLCVNCEEGECVKNVTEILDGGVNSVAAEEKEMD